MKLNNSISGEIVGENVGKTKSFGFEVNAKAFRLLSDNIYKDKIGSIVRELSSNAYDAHKAANNEKTPFYIHLPTSFERFFSIRDYGIGLCKEDIHKVYSTYFKSTKDNSNDMIGAFGLGSKTPFSYTDTFTIKSYFNEKLYIFVAMVDANGIPILSEMGVQDTTEHNGLEISFSVENYGDFGLFSRACVDQLKFFDVKPSSNIDIKWDSPFNVIKDYGKLKVLSGSNEIYVKIGQVGYLISYHEIVNKLSDDRKIFFDIFHNVIIEADIGNVEVTVSREGLSYSKQTISFLEKFVDELSKLIFNDIREKWDTVDNDFERIKLLDVFDKPANVFKLLHLSFKNSDIVTVNGGFVFNIKESGVVMPIIYSSKSSTGIRVTYPANNAIALSSKNIYILQSKVKYYKWRVSGIFNDYTGVYILDLDAPGAANYKDLLNILPLTKMETLPVPSDFEERKKAMKPTCWLADIENITHPSLNRGERIFDDFDEDVTTEKVYIVRGYSGGYKTNYSANLLSSFKKAKVLSHVYCIRPEDEDDVKKMSNFIPLNIFVEKKILESKTANLDDVIRLSKKHSLLSSIKYTITESELSGLLELSKSRVSRKVKNIVIELETRIKNISDQRQSYVNKLSKVESCLMMAASFDYDSANYISLVKKYIQLCVDGHSEELRSLNQVKRHNYYDVTSWKYIIKLIDEKIDLASVH